MEKSSIVSTQSSPSLCHATSYYGSMELVGCRISSHIGLSQVWQLATVGDSCMAVPS